MIGKVFERDKLRYTILEDGESVSITKGVFSDLTGDLIIPSAVTCNGKSYNVTKIGFMAFAGCSNIENITIPNCITSIESSAFDECCSLTNIVIPESVTSIGSRAFSWCRSLTSIFIPKYVVSIGEQVFEGCYTLQSMIIDEMNDNYCTDKYGVLYNKDKTELIQYLTKNNKTDFSIPNSVTKIESGAFAWWKSLTSITIPKSVTSIGIGAFKRCDSLQNIIVDEMNDYYSSDEYGVLYNKDKTELIRYQGKYERTSFTIPDSVTRIGYRAFEWCSLESIILPYGVTEIGESAFEYCEALENIIIPNSVVTIKEDAFFGCTSLESIIIPDSVTEIGSNAFYDCYLSNGITISSNITTIKRSTFNDCSMTSITIPKNVTNIETSAFNFCDSLKYITMESNIPPNIEPYAFDYVDATVIIPKGSKQAYDPDNKGWWTGLTIMEEE